MNSKPLSIPPDLQERTIAYQGYFDILVDHLTLPQGECMTYTHLDAKVHASAVLARTREGLLIINKEYRHPTGLWLIGCPGGRIDPGESPLEAARRELHEETGYNQGLATPLGEVFALPAITGQIIHYVFIDAVELSSAPKKEPFECIHIELKTPQELMREISSGHPVDGILCTALFLARKYLQ